METVLQKLEILRKESSTLQKTALLKDYLQDPLFKKVVQYALNTEQYQIKTIPEASQKSADIGKLFSFLDRMAIKKGSSKEDKQELADICGDSAIVRDIVTRILLKDLMCGVSVKLANKAEKNLIMGIPPYQRCSGTTYKHNVSYPALCQLKANGTFVNLIIEDQKVTYTARKGKRFIFPEDSLQRELLQLFSKKNVVVMGEFLVKRDGQILSRKTGNGIITKALKGTISEEESRQICIQVWDYMPLSDFLNESGTSLYKDRFQLLQQVLSTETPRVALIYSFTVDSYEQAEQYAQQKISEGFEGAVLKDMSATWKNNTCTSFIKIKAEKDCDLRVIGWYPGAKNTKYEQCLGGLTCVSSDRLLQVDVGGGFLDEVRGFLGFDEVGNPRYKPDMTAYLDSFVGNIVTVEYNETITNKVDDMWSLSLPRFVEVRDDKVEADSLEKIKLI